MAWTCHTGSRPAQTQEPQEDPDIKEDDDDDDDDVDAMEDAKDPKDKVVDYDACKEKATGEWPRPDLHIPKVRVHKDVVDYYINVIHFNPVSTCALHMDQCIRTIKTWSGLPRRTLTWFA